MTLRDLLGDPVAAAPKKASQLALNLSMGVSIRWGGQSLAVSLDPDCGSIVALPVDFPEFGPRWAAALKVLYPGRKAGELNHKGCARALGVSPRTAEGWGGGQAPNGKVFWRAWHLHRARLLALLAPELAPPGTVELLATAERLRSSNAELAGAVAALTKGGA